MIQELRVALARARADFETSSTEKGMRVSSVGKDEVIRLPQAREDVCTYGVRLSSY